MTSRKLFSAGLGAAAAAGLTFLAVGCASSTKVDQFPKNLEATVAANPTVPDKVESIEARPWTVVTGQRVDFVVAGTKNRAVSLTVTGLDGEARGRTQKIDLSAQAAGYVGAITSGAPGQYRLEATMLGGPSGEPVKLVSSRALNVTVPPPPPVDKCDELKSMLATPRIHFAYDKSDIDAATDEFVKQLAAKLQDLGPRVGRLTIEGHCDERGTVNYNLALGDRRAKAVVGLLEKAPGMSGLKIDKISKGKEEPLILNAKTEEEHAQNRRAVVILECVPAK